MVGNMDADRRNDLSNFIQPPARGADSEYVYELKMKN